MKPYFISYALRILVAAVFAAGAVTVWAIPSFETFGTVCPSVVCHEGADPLQKAPAVAAAAAGAGRSPSGSRSGSRG